MNHAIKEQISDNTLYVEVEPQPDEDTDETFFKQDSLCYVGSDGKITHDITPPILVGDTVYHGEEWGHDPINILGNGLFTKKMWSASVDQPPQTMPIELADKMFKVVGIEVELMPRHVASPEKPLADCDYRDLDEVWFWKYSLEEI